MSSIIMLILLFCYIIMKKTFDLVRYMTLQQKLNRKPPALNVIPKICTYAESENIFVSNPEKLKTKIMNIKSQGKDNLEIMADFDFTLTRYRYASRFCDATNSIWSNTRILQSDLRANLFYSLRIKKVVHSGPPSFESPRHEAESLHKWSLFTEKVLLRQNLSFEIIKQIIPQLNIIFRYGIQQFLSFVNTYPMLIVSGGLYDIIYYLIQSILKEDVHKIDLLANQINYDSQLRMIGFKQPLAHGLMKGTVGRECTKRKNVILVGDQLTDIAMVRHRPEQTYISICLMTSIIEAQYLYDNYDIVILGDPSLLAVNYILGYFAGNISNQAKNTLELGGKELAQFFQSIN